MSITLAFEAAIAGGSISLLDGDVEIESWVGSSDLSKAEDLLLNIDALLCDKGLRRQDIRLIAVSAGPGSFTGIRIAVATALGLKNGLGVTMRRVSALEAIAATATDEIKVVAIPMGRNSVCFQRFTVEKADPPRTLDHEGFDELVRTDDRSKYIVHEKLFAAGSQLAQVDNFGSNVARAVGLFAITNPEAEVEPLFISKTAL